MQNLEAAGPGPAGRNRRINRRAVTQFALTLPAVLFLALFLLVPSVVLLTYSVGTQSAAGEVGFPITFTNFLRLLDSATYRGILYNTIEISLWTTLVAAVLAYPLALTVVRGNPLLGRITLILVVAPMVMSVVVRTYGWQLLLANGPQGVLNYVLMFLGAPMLPRILYTQWAVIIASIHVFLPLVVLPLATSLARIPANLPEAARMLGASDWRVFFAITLPLSLPGLLTGSAIVFTLTSASYVTPQMIGGAGGAMLGVLLEQQINTVYDWPMGAAIATIMVLLTLIANILAGRLMARAGVIRGNKGAGSQ